MVKQRVLLSSRLPGCSLGEATKDLRPSNQISSLWEFICIVTR
jgi:hypothetical protein